MSNATASTQVINPIPYVTPRHSQIEFAESVKLEQAIKANLKGLGYGG